MPDQNGIYGPMERVPFPNDVKIRCRHGDCAWVLWSTKSSATHPFTLAAIQCHLDFKHAGK